MSENQLQRLLSKARGPCGPEVEVDFGVDNGPLYELQQVLSSSNGFFAFNAGIQVYRVGEQGIGPELLTWNETHTWKYTYGSLANDYFFFGQDVLGTQFGIEDGKRVISFDPETATVAVIGESLAGWANWLFDDLDVRATAGLARLWQDTNGALTPDQRLVPRQFFVTGGQVALDNLVARDRCRSNAYPRTYRTADLRTSRWNKDSV